VGHWYTHTVLARWWRARTHTLLRPIIDPSERGVRVPCELTQ